MSRFRGILTVLLVPSVLAACQGPTDFSHTLAGILQFNPLSTTYYAVGDTLEVTGTLGGPHGGLVLQVGGVDAPIVSFVEMPGSSSPSPGVTINTTTDAAKIVITAAMVGTSQQVTGTLHGIEREAGVVYVSLTRPLPTRSDTLSYDTIAVSYTVPGSGGDTLVARGDNGDGKVYILAGDTVELWQNGSLSVVLAGLADQYGPFHQIGAAGTLNNYMAVDKTGRYLYASLITSDTTAASATNLIFRLIKVDLVALTVQTLNRTLYPINPSQVTSAYASSLTMSGPVASVFLMPMSQIFPATDGTIYFVLDGLYANNSVGAWTTWWPLCPTPGIGLASTVGKIDPTGQVSYVVKAQGCGLPMITAQGVVDLLPTLSATHDWGWINVIDPDSGVAYASGSGTALTGAEVAPAWALIAYDLKHQSVKATFAPPMDGQENQGLSTNIAGPFSAVDGAFYVYGLVAGGGHRVWAVAAKPAPASPTGNQLWLVIIDFDAGQVTPYVALGTFYYGTEYVNSIYTNEMFAFVNHDANGDPLLTGQIGGGSGGLLPADNTFAATAATAAARMRGRRR